jgi:hypothetical protein
MLVAQAIHIVAKQVGSGLTCVQHFVQISAGIQTVVTGFPCFSVKSLVILPLDAVVQATGSICKQIVQNGRIVNYESERMWKRVTVA